MICGVADYAGELTNAISRQKGDFELTVVTFKEASHDATNAMGASIRVSVQNVLEKRMWGRGVADFIVNKIGPDLVHVQSTTFLYPRRFAIFPTSIPTRIPVMVTAHDIPGYRQFHIYPVLNRVYSRANLIVTLSQHVADELIQYHRVSPRKILTMHHGVDTRRYSPATSPEDFYKEYELSYADFTVMTFGFLGKGKGHEYLLPAFKRLRTAHPGKKMRLVFAGAPKDDKSYLRELEAMIREKGIEDDTFITGYVRPQLVPSTLAASDVLVYPYRGVSQSGPVHLALSMGKACVVSDVPGFREIIKNEVNGLVVPVGESMPLFRALERLYADKDERARIGGSARLYAESKLDIEEVARQTLEIYSSVLEGVPSLPALREQLYQTP